MSAREGITLAKQRGAYRGRKKSLSADQVDQLVRRAGQVDQLVRRAGAGGNRSPHWPASSTSAAKRSTSTSAQHRPRRIDLSHRSIILALTDCGW